MSKNNKGSDKAKMPQQPAPRSVVSPSSSTASKQTVDTNFEPTIDMLVNDFDDERTLEEEEALAQEQDPNEELNDLQKESDMPIEELLALYNCAPRQQPAEVVTETKIDETEPEANTNEEIEEEPSQLMKLYSPANNLQLLEVDEEADIDYSPDEDDIKKTIMVGGDYQAAIPEGLCKYDDALPYENEDKLLWNPSILEENQTEEYLEKVKNVNHQGNTNGTDVYAIPNGKHLRDDEQSLLLLLQCGHNVDEALRRKRINAVQPSETMSSWSEEECRNFECGLRIYGKDFHAIQQSKVRTRSVGELVQFYYIWKKTERHDVFASKTRLEKKKYSLHPGLTDHMDRFLEEQENGNVVGGRDRSSSPAVSSLLYAADKKHSL